VLPGAELLSKLRTQPALGNHPIQHVLLKKPAQHRRVDPAEGRGNSVLDPGPIAHPCMDVGVPIEWISPGLYGEAGARSIAWTQSGFEILTKSLPSTTAQVTQELTVPAQGRAQDFGNRPHPLTVVHLLERRYPLGLT